MSSNMAIPKTCSYCGKAFIAKTTLTRYCGHTCNSRHYKQKVKEDKIQNSLVEQQQTMQSLPTLQTANSNSLHPKLLSVQDAAELIGVSRWTINRMIKRENYKFTSLAERK